MKQQRFFCSLHAHEFQAPAGTQSPVCRFSKGSPHIIGSDFPKSTSWAYCVVCDIFFARTPAPEPGQEAPIPRRCPQDSHEFTRAYQCDSCGVLVLSGPEGAPRGTDQRINLDPGSLGPRPNCPACGEPPRSTPVAHPDRQTCPGTVQLDYRTARTTCPFCRKSPVPAGGAAVAERQAAPSPPAPVRQAPEPEKKAVGVITEPPRVGWRPPVVPIAPPPPPSAPPAPIPAPDPEITGQVPTPTRPNRNPLVVVAALAVVVVLAWVVFGPKGFIPRIEKALAENRIFNPPGDCVADIYAAEAAKNPGSASLAKAAAMIRPRLQPVAEEAIQRWYTDAEPTPNWEELGRAYSLLASMFPSEAAFRARSAYCRAEMKIAQRDYRGALELYNESLSIVPNVALVLNGVGKVYIRTNNERAAVESYEKATAADPAFTWSRKNLGDHYRGKNDWERAETYYRDALRTAPGRASVLRGLGYVVYRQKRYVEALEYLRNAAAAEKDPTALGNVQKLIAEVEAKGRQAGLLN